jgi:hypothetical protein
MKILEDQFLGKLISIQTPERDNFGNITPHKFIEVKGICQFIGENEMLGCPLQVTIDRTPYEIKHITHIKNE